MEKCQNPECEYMANPDPSVSVGFCCEKCEGRFKGEEWASQGKKKHTAYCTSKTMEGAGMWSMPFICPPVAAAPTEVETYDPETEAKLDQWVELKRAKDFASADALREELRAQGIDPGQARPQPGSKGAAWGGGGKDAFAGAAWGGGGKGDFGMMGAWGKGMMMGPAPCANPECWYMKSSDPSVSQWYCCEKCEAVHAGEEWALSGKKHYKSCEKIEQDASGGYGPMMGMMGMMGGKGGWGKGKWGPY